jgi:hypothetical protein
MFMFKQIYTELYWLILTNSHIFTLDLTPLSVKISAEMYTAKLHAFLILGDTINVYGLLYLNIFFLNLSIES